MIDCPDEVRRPSNWMKRMRSNDSAFQDGIGFQVPTSKRFRTFSQDSKTY